MRTALAMLLLALPLTAAPVPKALKKTNTLDGTWRVMERYAGTTRIPIGDDILWSIDGEALTVSSTTGGVPDGFAANATRTITRVPGGETNEVVYTINFTDGSPSSVRPAIYELDGETFKICLSATHNGRRPEGCTPTDGTMMYVLKRPKAK